MRTTRTALHALVAAAALAAAGLDRPAPARAALDERPAATWMVNGPVRALARSGDILWIGGRFTELRERPTGAGGRVIRVRNLAAVDADTGRPVRGLHMPRVTGTDAIVYAIYAIDGRIYVGGDFDAVDGRRRHNLAAVNARTGAVRRFRPQIGRVWALAADDRRLYVGGTFTRAAGRKRTRLAAFTLRGALVRRFRPRLDERPRDMVLGPKGDSLVVVGQFDHASGPGGRMRARNSVARFNVRTGKLSRWTAGCPCSAKLHGLGIARSRTRFYIGMAGSDWVGAFDVRSGEQVWHVDTSGQVQDVALVGRRVVIGGHYQYVAPTPGGRFNCFRRPRECVRRFKLAALRLDGTLDRRWDPSMRGDYDGVWVLRRDHRRVWAGGEFTAVGGARHDRLALFRRH